MSDDAQSLAEAMLRGCAANVGPLIGVDLEVGEVTLESGSEVPDGNLAVLPMSVELDDTTIADLTLSSAMSEIATLARRLLDDDEPDKEREVNDDEIDAIGEVLNLMSGAVDQSIREHINSSYRSRPISWWRTDDAGGNSFSEGSFRIAKGPIHIPSAGSVELTFRISEKLFGQPQTTRPSRTQGRVLLIGLDEELATRITDILCQAQVTAVQAEPGTEEFRELLPSTDAMFLAGDGEDALQLVRRLRLAHDSWEIPTIVCLSNPTKARVLEALDDGATYVMAVPTDEISLLRILRAARPDER